MRLCESSERERGRSLPVRTPLRPGSGLPEELLFGVLFIASIFADNRLEELPDAAGDAVPLPLCAAVLPGMAEGAPAPRDRVELPECMAWSRRSFASPRAAFSSILIAVLNIGCELDGRVAAVSGCKTVVEADGDAAVGDGEAGCAEDFGVDDALPLGLT